MEYSFDVETAIENSVDEAVFLKNIAFWLSKNMANEKHFYDGKYWTYNSVEAFSTLFPFWSAKQIRRITKSLIDKEIIQTGNYNKMKYDRTLWYTIVDEKIMYRLVNPICPNGQMETPKQENGYAEKGEPIPYIKPNVNKDNKPYIYTGEKEVIEHWNMHNLIIHNLKTILNKKTHLSKITNKIKEFGIDHIKQTISNYASVYHSDQTYWSHKYALHEFLDRKYETFTPENHDIKQWLKQEYKKEQEKNSKLQDHAEKMKAWLEEKQNA